jgi:hypothetical protein
MEKFEKTLEDFCQEFIKELRGEYIDKNTVKDAQEWYKKYTGKEYNGNIKDLVEMFNIIRETR